MGVHIPCAHDELQWKLCLRTWDDTGDREGWKIAFPERHPQGEETFDLDLPVPQTSSAKYHFLAPPECCH